MQNQKSEKKFQTRPSSAKPAAQPKLYLELFHGRRHPEEQLNDWGAAGPTFGPLKYVHTTYANEVKFCMEGADETHELRVVNDLLYYDGYWYGDWSIFIEAAYEGETAEYDPAKAVPPGTEKVGSWTSIPTKLSKKKIRSLLGKPN